MLRLNRYVVTLVLWVACLFNVERISFMVDRTNVLNESPEVYVAVLLVIVLGVILPQWFRISWWAVQLLAAMAFLTAVLTDGRPDWGGSWTYVSLVGLTEVMVSAILAYQVGRLSKDFVDAVQGLIFNHTDSRILTFDEMESSVRRELQLSRRSSRPLSVVVVQPGEAQEKIIQNATIEEIQGLIVKRNSLVSLARMVARNLRRTDLILYQRDEDRLVLVAPETHAAQTDELVERLQSRAINRFGMKVQTGVATFPEHGLTFGELVSQAERGLKREGEDTGNLSSPANRQGAEDISEHPARSGLEKEFSVRQDQRSSVVAVDA